MPIRTPSSSSTPANRMPTITPTPTPPSPPPENPPRTPQTPTPTPTPQTYETTHVHHIYTRIAPHFSQTRHTPWPTPARFLLSQPPGSIGLDIGCGNGKYLVPELNNGVVLVGSDACGALVGIAGGVASVGVTGAGAEGRRREEDNGRNIGGKGGEGGGAGTADVVVADILNLPHRSTAFPSHSTTSHSNPTFTTTAPSSPSKIPPSNTTTPTHSPPRTGFDFVLTIAVLHHLSTRERRIKGVAEILAYLRTGGRLLVFVWAVEQGVGSRRRGLLSREGDVDRDGGEDGKGGGNGGFREDGSGEGGEGRGKDVLVPWVMQERSSRTARFTERSKKKTKKHARHSKSANDSTQELPNGIHKAHPEASSPKNATPETSEDKEPKQQIFQRYYHLYAQGELEEDVLAAGGRVIEGGWERDNWWCICEPVRLSAVVEQRSAEEEGDENG